MFEKEFISLFTEKTVTELLNEKDLNQLTGLGKKRLSNNIELLNTKYLLKPDSQLSLERFDLANIDIERVLLDYSHSFVLPDDFRKMLLYVIIYIQADAYSILELQEKLDVSRNTIIADLKKLNQDLERVAVQYDRKKGYVLKGNEEEIRKYALYYIFTLYKELEIKGILIKSCGIKKQEFDYWLERTYRGIKDYHLTVMTGQVAEIVIFILSTVLRKQNVVGGSQIIIPENYLPSAKYQRFSHSYAELVSSETELNYISVLFAAISQEELTGDEHVFSKAFMKFLTMFNVISGIAVLNDSELVRRLKLHSIAMMYREKYFIFLGNDLIKTIANTNKSLNGVILEAVGPLEEALGKPISKTEIGYLVAIIESHLQSRNEHFPLLRAIILCPNGTTSSVLLKNELEELFPALQFSKASSLSNFKEINPSDYDIIFSTISVKTQKDLYIISNFLSSFEKQKLQTEITKRFNLPTLKIPSYKEVETLLFNYHEQKQSVDDVYEELVGIITRDTKRQKEWSPVLKELLTKDTIKINVAATDWEDAVRKSGEILVETGAIQESYVEAMVASVKTYGSYIVITPHIALAHASSNDGVNEIGFSLITLKDEIKFNHEENDPVKVVITLAATDQSTHLKALSELMELLGDSNFLPVAYDSQTTKEDIINLIHQLKEC